MGCSPAKLDLLTNLVRCLACLNWALSDLRRMVSAPTTLSLPGVVIPTPPIPRLLPTSAPEPAHQTLQHRKQLYKGRPLCHSHLLVLDDEICILFILDFKVRRCGSLCARVFRTVFLRGVLLVPLQVMVFLAGYTRRGCIPKHEIGGVTGHVQCSRHNAELAGSIDPSDADLATKVLR